MTRFARRLLCLAAPLALASLWAAATHAAIIIYSLEDVVFSDGGRAYGVFETNSATGDVVFFDIVTTAGAVLPGAAYNNATSYVYCNRCNSPPNSFAIDLDNNSRYIAMTFLEPLTVYGRDPLKIAPGYFENYECLDCNPYRNIVGGFALSVPEPAAWTMMLLGFGALGAVLRATRRRRISSSDPSSSGFTPPAWVPAPTGGEGVAARSAGWAR